MKSGMLQKGIGLVLRAVPALLLVLAVSPGGSAMDRGEFAKY